MELQLTELRGERARQILVRLTPSSCEQPALSPRGASAIPSFSTALMGPPALTPSSRRKGSALQNPKEKLARPYMSPYGRAPPLSSRIAAMRTDPRLVQLPRPFQLVLRLASLPRLVQLVPRLVSWPRPVPLSAAPLPAHLLVFSPRQVFSRVVLPPVTLLVSRPVGLPDLLVASPPRQFPSPRGALQLLPLLLSRHQLLWSPWALLLRLLVSPRRQARWDLPTRCRSQWNLSPLGV